VLVNRLELKAWLDDGLSLEQIGAIVGRHPSTVAYWLNKYGLVANGRDKHSPKGGLPKAELAALVSQGHTLAVIAEKFDVSIRTVRYWIDRLDLPSPRSRRREAIAKAIDEGRRTLLKECARHGWSIFVIENSGRTRCRRCRSERVSEWRRRTKAKLVEEAGGSCRICGYDRSLAALEFHHLNPAEKSFALSLRGVTRSIEVLREEAKKCVLLRANCHAAVEAGHLSL
jgi:transposase